MVYELVQASGQPKSFPSNFTDILQLNSGFYTGSIADTVKNRPFNLTGMCSIEIINGWSERKQYEWIISSKKKFHWYT